MKEWDNMKVPLDLILLLMLAFWRTTSLCFHFLLIFPISFISHKLFHQLLWGHIFLIFLRLIFCTKETFVLPVCLEYYSFQSCVFTTFLSSLSSDSFLHPDTAWFLPYIVPSSTSCYFIPDYDFSLFCCFLASPRLQQFKSKIKRKNVEKI